MLKCAKMLSQYQVSRCQGCMLCCMFVPSAGPCQFSVDVTRQASYSVSATSTPAHVEGMLACRIASDAPVQSMHKSGEAHDSSRAVMPNHEIKVGPRYPGTHALHDAGLFKLH
jgi:hypothetical protein